VHFDAVAAALFLQTGIFVKFGARENREFHVIARHEHFRATPRA
jgi:hypothetical protein